MSLRRTVGKFGRFAAWTKLMAAAALTALAPTLCYGVIRYTGVNLSGAEFGVSNNNVNLPGTYNTHYTYPTVAEIDYYVARGMNTFRLPFRWERLQQSQFAAFNATELNRMRNFVNSATSRGAHVILEPHNFQRYFPATNNFQSSSQGLVGSAVPDTAYADFWGKMAAEFRGNGRVIFNLMNEPNSMPNSQLVTSTNAAIGAIRTAGATNLIQVPGNSWTGAWTWVSSGNSTSMLGVVDPAFNMEFEVHQYLDGNGSGTSTQIGRQVGQTFVEDVNVGRDRLVAFTNWARANGVRGYLGEFAFANRRFTSAAHNNTGATNSQGETNIADEAMTLMLDYIEANSDVWTGWAWWGGGPWWGNYMFRLDPTTLNNPAASQEQASMQYLAPYLAAPITDDVPGDFNLDRVVDDRDLALFKIGVGQEGSFLAADADGDGKVNGVDLLIWQANLGRTAPTPARPASGIVPEPAAVTWAGVALVALARRRRR